MVSLHQIGMSTLLARQILRNFARMWITHVAIEASSHALDQNRFNNLTTNCISFAYVSRAHLDDQQTMHQYVNATVEVFTKSATDNTVGIIN